MMDHYRCVENTPSVYFNFQESQRKSEKYHEYIPYEYSITTNKNIQPQFIKSHKFQSTITPLCKKSTGNKQKNTSRQKVDTQQFFDDFQNNFEIKFGDSPLKCEFSKHLDFNFDHDEAEKENICKITSNISEPIQIQNIESYENTKQKSQKNSKIQCEIRKRILFKKSESLAQKGSTKRSKKKIINDQNLMIVTSGNWTGKVKQKKNRNGPFSQPIKAHEKKSQSISHNIFTAHNGFRQTLRSTTLDNWRKKHLSIKHKDIFHKNNRKVVHNLFEKPFSLIR